MVAHAHHVKNLALALSLAVMMIGCGRSDDLGNGALGLTGKGVVVCTDTNCPAINMTINSPNAIGGRLEARTGEDVNWEFNIITDVQHDRDLRIWVLEKPQGLECSGSGSEKIRCSGRFYEVMDLKPGVFVVARDVSRCRLETPQAAQDCQNGLKNIPGDVELKQNAAVIANPNYNTVDPRFTTDQGPQLGANSGLKGCGTGMLGGVLQGLAGGGGPLMNGLMGCFTGYVGGLAEPQPQN